LEVIFKFLGKTTIILSFLSESISKLTARQAKNGFEGKDLSGGCTKTPVCSDF